jgi:transcriptional regulator with XRE-family HTH domain
MKAERRRLRAIRADQEPKVSQSQVARKAGMGTFRYWQIENGEGPEPSRDEREAVAAALGVKVSAVAWPDGAEVRAS